MRRFDGGNPIIPLALCALWIVLALFLCADEAAVTPTCASVLASTIFSLVFWGGGAALTITEAVGKGSRGCLRRILFEDILPSRATTSIVVFVIRTLLTGLAALVVSAAITYATEHVAGCVGLELREQSVAELFSGSSGMAKAVLIISIVLITPVVEELFFRYAMERSLASRTGRPQMSSIIVALAFAAVHVNMLSFPALVAVSLIFSHAFARSGRLATPIIAHAFFNAVGLMML